MEAEKKNIVILFPGKNYGVANPLLYYAQLKYITKGFECLTIHYGDSLSEGKTLNDIKNTVFNQVRDIDFSSYGDILFISKSVGTVLAGWLAETLSIKARHIYLTPLQATLEYIKGQDIQIVVAGTKDKYLDSIILSQYCEKEKVKLELIENANHSLEINGDISENIDILKRIVQLY
jgi:2-hydroxy-3-keto-5-methylthiopentenyl-1-phosphate phosphatase